VRLRLAILIAAGILLAACGAPSGPSTEIEVLETEFAYSPKALTIPVNQPVTITLRNQGAIEHDFAVDQIAVINVVKEESGMGHEMAAGEEEAYDLHVSTAPGDTSVISFTATEPGSYKIICTIAGHLDAGMEASLTVVAE
jgi:uncharacterized cupredoxin-like copper-binding protein